MDDPNIHIPAQSANGTPIPKQGTGNAQRQINSTVWLSVEQIRKRERMRRERVIEAMASGALPFEQRGRIRYARLCDIIQWEEARISIRPQSPMALRQDLTDLL